MEDESYDYVVLSCFSSGNKPKTSRIVFFPLERGQKGVGEVWRAEVNKKRFEFT